MHLPSRMYWFADGMAGIVPDGFIWFLNCKTGTVLLRHVSAVLKDVD